MCGVPEEPDRELLEQLGRMARGLVMVFGILEGHLFGPSDGRERRPAGVGVDQVVDGGGGNLGRLQGLDRVVGHVDDHGAGMHGRAVGPEEGAVAEGLRKMVQGPELAESRRVVVRTRWRVFTEPVCGGDPEERCFRQGAG